MGALTAVSLVRDVHANAAAPYVNLHENAGQAVVADPTPLRVTAASLELTCGGSCRFKTVYSVSNPTQQAASAVGAFYGGDAHDMVILLQGRDASTKLTAEQTGTLDKELYGPEQEPPHWLNADLHRAGFAVRLPPGVTQTLTFESTLGGVRVGTKARGYAIPGIAARHLAVTQEVPPDGYADFSYVVAPLRTWTTARSMQVVVHVEDGYEIQDGIFGRVGPGETGRATVDISKVEAISFRVIDHSEPIAVVGGPMLGIGGGIDHSEFLLRAGYELAAPYWLAWGLMGETNADDMWRAALTATALTDNVLFVPYVGAGVGGIVRSVDGKTDVGARAQLTLGFPIVGVAFPFDYYPGASDESFEASVLFLLSL